jgi:malate dehydrogenase (oxaloacetate-decarboxylating)
MPSKFERLPLSTSGPLECALKGTVLLNHPYFNKGSAFTAAERRDFELTGLLPPSVQTLEQQAQRAYEQYSAGADDLAKNTFLTSMKEQNVVLYFKVRQAGRQAGRYRAASVLGGEKWPVDDLYARVVAAGPP